MIHGKLRYQQLHNSPDKMGHKENEDYKYKHTLIKKYSGFIEKGEIEQGGNEFDILHFLTLLWINLVFACFKI